MPRTSNQVDINGFEGGLVTDHNPLEAKPNTTSDEANMNLNKDKSRSRRLGFDLEDSVVLKDSLIAYQSPLHLGKSVFNWGNAGGDVDKELLVVQVGQHMAVYDLDNTPVTSVVVYEETFTSDYSTDFTYAVVDGILVVANGMSDISYYTYDGASITKDTTRLLVRDLFGVESEGDGYALTDSANFQYRPAVLEDEHLYNLRNGTFHKPYPDEDAAAVSDTIRAFELEAVKFPSNSDNLLQFLFPNAGNATSRTAERFWPKDMVKQTSESSTTPTGFFIIDALSRGTSRVAKELAYTVSNPSLFYGVTTLPVDETPDGARVIAEYAGRVWYSGFSSEVSGGDKHSPKMSSFVLFSQTVKDFTDIPNCFQQADPTSNIDPNLVATDGGFIRIDGAYDIKAMINITDKLFVFAKNGVWSISGPDQGGFKATDFLVRKVSDHGLDAGKSVTVVDETAFYWGEESIYFLSPDKVTGAYSASDVTTTVIKSYYLDIPLEERKTCTGYFDKYTRKIHWVYSKDLTDSALSNELIFNVDFSSYTINTVNVHNSYLPRIVDLGPTQPYHVASTLNGVTAVGVGVVAGGVPVEALVESRLGSAKELVYLVITQLYPTIVYGLGRYDDGGFSDWQSLGGIDTPAYMVANYLTGGVGRFKKQTPYLTTFFKQTEDGIDVNFDLTGQSSCQLSTRWDWSNSNASNKWSTPRQAYRIRRPFFGEVGSFDNGNSILRTKNRIRGWGSSIAFKVESEAGKNMHLYGWGFDMDQEGVE